MKVDEPSQRFQTKTGSGAQTVWDQTFTMYVSLCSILSLSSLLTSPRSRIRNNTFAPNGLTLYH